MNVCVNRQNWQRAKEEFSFFYQEETRVRGTTENNPLSRQDAPRSQNRSSIGGTQPPGRHKGTQKEDRGSRLRTKCVRSPM